MIQQPIKRNGYYYGPRTRTGFLRMQRMGIPAPPFKLENKITKQIASYYKATLKELVEKFKKYASQYARDHAMVTDSSLIERMKEKGNALEQTQARMQAGSSLDNLQTAWLGEDIEQGALLLGILSLFGGNLAKGRKDFFEKFNADASDELLNRLYGKGNGPNGETITGVITAGDIPRAEAFENRIEDLERLYFEDAKERLIKGVEYQQMCFVNKVQDYVNGKSETLDIEQIVNELSDKATVMARFMARDEMSKFNKALTVTSYKQAGVTRVRWVTCHDSRVRQTHKMLDGKTFPIDELPPEATDFNCRCGLVPAEYKN